MNPWLLLNDGRAGCAHDWKERPMNMFTVRECTRCDHAEFRLREDGHARHVARLDAMSVPELETEAARLRGV